MIIDHAMAAALEAAFAAHAAGYAATIARLQPGSVAAALELAGGQLVATGRSFPINRAVGLGMGRPVAAWEFDQLERFYDERGLPPALEICPLADDSLRAFAGERGYRLDHFYNILVHSSEALWPESGEVRVEQVAADDNERWAALSAAAFAEGQPADPEGVGSILALSGVERPGGLAYLAYVDGALAGVGALARYGEVALLFSMATFPSYRRRGVQAALIRARLHSAAHMGCRLAVAQTNPGNSSQRNLQRAGFAVAYTRAVVRR